MDHPFPRSSFKITSQTQIDTLRSLGLRYVNVRPDLSDPAEPEAEATPAAPGTATDSNADSTLAAMAKADAEARAKRLAAQKHGLQVCERRFGEATRQYRQMLDQIQAKPAEARGVARAMVGNCVNELLSDGETAIRLLGDHMGDRSVLHPVNVMIGSLLLGKALGLSESELVWLGKAALLHDIGKLQLPDRVRHLDMQNFSSAEIRMYQEHVALGVAQARKMGMPVAVILAIAQHHELADGTGFPKKHTDADLSVPGKILCLVNRYDNLCNPPKLAQAMTPHEALSTIFSQLKPRFDAVVLGAFIRMMGVYPPGSVVQLTNDQYALVVSVNSSRPLRPRVIVYDPSVPAHDALVLDLETTPGLGVRRSFKATQLPKPAFEYLAPRQRIIYYFERAGEASAPA